MQVTRYLILNCRNIYNTYIYTTLIQVNNMKPQNKAELEVTPYAIALYQFYGRAEDELSFNVGDIILLIKHIDDQWTEGELDGQSGIFPTSFVTIEVDCPHAFTVNQKNYSVPPNSCLKTHTNSELGGVEDLTYQNISSNNGSGNITKFIVTEAALPQLQNPLTQVKASIKLVPKRPAPAPPQTVSTVNFGKETTIPESNSSRNSVKIPGNSPLSRPVQTDSTQCPQDVKTVRPRISRNKGTPDLKSGESMVNTDKEFPRPTVDSQGGTCNLASKGKGRDHSIPIPAPRTSLLKDKDTENISKPPKPTSRSQVKTSVVNKQEKNAHLISPDTNKTKPFIDLTGVSKALQALVVKRKSEPMQTLSETSDHLYSEIDTDIDSYYASIDTLDYRKPKTGHRFIGQMSTNDLSAENSAKSPQNVPERSKTQTRSTTSVSTVSLCAAQVISGATNDLVTAKSSIQPIAVSATHVKEPLTSHASKSQFFVPLLSNESSSEKLKYANISTVSPVSKNYSNILDDIYPQLAAKNAQHHADVENMYEDMTQFKPNSVYDKTEYEVMSKVEPDIICLRSSPRSPPPSLPPKKRGSAINSPFIPLP